MARTLPKAVLVASTVVVYGCAPWTGKQSADYVTVETESGHDTNEATKHYQAARQQMTKHVHGESCNLATVEKRLQQALAADVRYGPAHHSLGVVYFWQKKLYLAAWEFEYAARLMPDRFEPLNNLGLVYESAGKLDQAMMYYCLAREKAQSHPEVIGNLARASSRSGQAFDEMRPLLEDILATDTRPEWRSWAREQLGLHLAASPPPPPTASPATDSSPSTLPASDEPSSVEELPLIVPPLPGLPPPESTLDKATEQPKESGSALELELGSLLKEATLQ